MNRLADNFDWIRILAGFLLGMLTVVNLVTVVFYLSYSRRYRWKAPAWSVILIRISYCLLSTYVVFDQIERLNFMYSWRIWLAVLAIGSGIPASLSILHHLYTEQASSPGKGRDLLQKPPVKGVE